MNVNDLRAAFRVAVYNRDGHALLTLLADGNWPPDALQLIGDGLVDALGEGVPAAASPARRCIAELRERRWEGDVVLAEALEAQLDTGSVRCCVRCRSTLTSSPPGWKATDSPPGAGPSWPPDFYRLV
ncbi:MAG: hypothetical protein VB093_17300 [Propionicimonas sp.]|nr:hypothetical protein [Propionicimonas sp.]MEA5118515.1 hypothetical protein [Propionicimonas sp.]